MIKDGIDLKALSKKVSYALRHDPQKFGVTVEADGWANIDDLARGIRAEEPEWRHLKAEHFRQMVEVSRSFRYELSGDRIRALYGHTKTLAPMLHPEQPPAMLYHGTDEVAARIIFEEGLKPLSRNFVHLTEDRRYAQRARHSKSGRPVVLLVDSGKAFETGIRFSRANTHVWLSDPIPARFITRETKMVA